MLRVQADADPMMTSTVAERPARYDGSNPQAVTTPSRPVSPMNTIGEGATPLMYACQQSRDQDVKNILAKNVSVNRKQSIHDQLFNGIKINWTILVS
jgi:hypothetical protein